jgi:hypothetical protein
MATITQHVSGSFDRGALELALRSLAIRLDQDRAAPVEVVVCGGSALLLAGLVARTTRDVDVVALIRDGLLCSPAPLPDDLQRAVGEVAEDLGLAGDWLNNGPSRDEGGLFQMGLPAGFAGRLRRIEYGARLAVYVIDRLDQIHFKLYAAADRGGYHIADLQALGPSTDELVAAARWAMTHDVSEGFAAVLRKLLGSIGYADAADRL